jgi:hypothetical protein
MNYSFWVTVTISPIIYAFWVIAECSRLTLGYYGNLQERVRSIACQATADSLPILFQHLISPTHYRSNFLLAGPALCRLPLHLDLSAAAHQCLHGLPVVARHAVGPPRRDNLDSVSTRSIGRRRTHHSTHHQVRIIYDFIIFVLSGGTSVAALQIINCAASIHISLSLLFLSH